MLSNLIMIGITFLVGAVSIFVTLYLSKRNRGLIQKITGLFEASQKVGIVTAYENREKALMSYETINTKDHASKESIHSFVSHLKTERKLIVVGSSLLGLKMYVDHLPEIIAGRVSKQFCS